MGPNSFLAHLPTTTGVVIAALSIAVVALAVVAVIQQRRLNSLERKVKRAGREPLYRGDRF